MVDINHKIQDNIKGIALFIITRNKNPNVKIIPLMMKYNLNITILISLFLIEFLSQDFFRKNPNGINAILEINPINNIS